MIYTLCVSQITNLQAELYLYQFRTIIRVLSSHAYFRATPRPAIIDLQQLSQPGCPTGARSAVPSLSRQLCAGPFDKTSYVYHPPCFCKNPVANLSVVKTKSDCPQPGLLGNCPEWIIFIIVCRRRGQYESICVTLVRPANEPSAPRIDHSQTPLGVTSARLGSFSEIKSILGLGSSRPRIKNRVLGLVSAEQAENGYSRSRLAFLGLRCLWPFDWPRIHRAALRIACALPSLT